MKANKMKAVALGFCSNSFYAQANTTIPNTDNPNNDGLKRWDRPETFFSLDWLSIRQSKKLKFPIEGEIINGNQFHFKGDGGWWNVCHFAFKEE